MTIVNGFARYLVVAALLAISTSAFAQFPNYPEPYLPAMSPCVNSTPQPLPVKWQATALMAPYHYAGKRDDFSDLSSRAPLQVGRFVYDGENSLMRGTRYGVKSSGVVDLLISDDATWVLAGSYDDPICVGTLRTPYKVPSRIWQNPASQPLCVGNHAVAPTIDTGPKVDWWKQKSPITVPGANGEAADWYWFDSKGYPTRTMFWDKHDGLPAIIGDYAFSNFYSFAPGNDIDLSAIAAKCRGAQLPVWNDEHIAELQAQTATPDSNPAGDLIPGLSYQACLTLNAQPPSWPVEVYISSFSTAAKYSTPKPLSTSVYYKPSVPELRTRLHKMENGVPTWSDALLIDHDSYGVDFNETPPYAQTGCARGPYTSLPGSPHMKWGALGSCQCMGVIENNPVLSPNRNTEIIGCPLPLTPSPTQPQTGNTLFWMWYTISDPQQPVVFLQTQPNVTIGTGLSLADYAHWQPRPVSDDIFTRPSDASCPQVPPSEGNPPPPACMGCHNASTN